MVVDKDGNKWACQSCLKGHRVSGCTHTDRELTLVPKKGRPVTQCQHCRQERKKRSAHVKCDCGEDSKVHHPREKCIHLREAEERQKASGFHDDDHTRDINHLTAVHEEQGCCCHHGGKCTCAALKKERERDGDDTVLPHGKPAVQKPRLEPTRSESQLTVFQNGHHKPVHRKNHAAHESGMPYKLPMQRSHTDDALSCVARRSVDSLSLDPKPPMNPMMSHPPPTSVPFDVGRRMSKSEHASPRLMPLDAYSGLPNATFSSQDLGTFSLEPPGSAVPSAAASDTFGFPSLDTVSSAADSSFDPWSALPSSEPASMPNNNPFGVWPTPDTTGMAQPALSAASSGTPSEVDDLPAMDDAFGFGVPSMPEEPSTEFSFENNVASPMSQLQQNSNRHSLPPDFFSSFGNNTANGGPHGQFNGMAGIAEEKPKGMHAANQTLPPSSNPFDISSPPTSNPHRRTIGSSDHPFGGASTASSPGVGRPTSHSVGPSSAPNDDLMKELFPGIDIPITASPALMNAKTSEGFAHAHMATSMPNDFGAFDDAAGGITSPPVQPPLASPWNNPTSMSVSNENLASPYVDMGQTYPPQSFSPWQQ